MLLVLEPVFVLFFVFVFGFVLTVVGAGIIIAEADNLVVVPLLMMLLLLMLEAALFWGLGVLVST